MLLRLLDQPQAIDQLSRTVGFSMTAKRLLLCLHCARLDVARLADVLKSGVDLDKLVHREANPVYEACTSHLLWAHELPDYLPLAWRYARIHGAAGTASVRVKAIEPAAMTAEWKAAQAAIRSKRAALEAFTLDDAALAAQTARRIDLLQQLFDAGLDPERATRNMPDFWIRDLVALEQPELLRALVRSGVSLRAAPYEIETLSASQRQMLDDVLAGAASSVTAPAFRVVDASPWNWELVGETSLLATTIDTHEGPVARISVHHGYGPLDDCRVELHVGGSAGGGRWLPMRRCEELIDIDGERRLRRPGQPAPFGEVPWSATFELPLAVLNDVTTPGIRVTAPSIDLDYRIDDWCPLGVPA